MSVRQQLADHPVTRDLAAHHLDVLAAVATEVRIPAGSWIARSWEPATRFLLLREGRAAIELAPPGRAAVIVATLHEGEVLGWSWLVPPHRWQVDVLALDEVRALAVDTAALRPRLDEDPSLGFELAVQLMSAVAHRLAATRLQLVDLSCAPSPPSS